MIHVHTIKNRGYVMLVSLVFIGIFFTIAGALINSVVQYAKVGNYMTASTQALSLAEAGIDKAIDELNQNQSYVGETDTALGSGTFSVTVATVNATTKTITATGYIPNSTNPTALRTVRVTANIGESVISFRYGIQVGSGGFNMSGGSQVNGSIYSNGSIIATNGSRITGAAVAANPPSTSADQVNDQPDPISTCTTSNCITFGNATASEDFAQSFRISSELPLNNIQFYIKKVGNPGDATVRITNDNGGVPSNTALMTGSLSASAVTTSFGWVTVTLPPTPVLSPDQTYWIVIDAGSNASRYYIIGANSNGYSNGATKRGRYGTSWSDITPAGLDGYFRVYLGGGTSLVGGGNYVGAAVIGTTALDDVWAHEVKGVEATGVIYCQIGEDNNRDCNTSRAAPTPQPMPLSDSNIEEWKQDAESGGVTTGDIAVGWAGATLGPQKIIGNLLVNGGGTLTVSGTLWVTGNITVTGGGIVRLASSYGTNSGAIVTDGYVTLNGGANFAGSGQSGSYPFLITTSACPVAPGCGGNNALSLSGGAGTVALIAQNGTAQINGGSSLKQVTAKQVVMSGGAVLNYDSGLISENFSSGPGGSWGFVPGTYTIVD